MSETNASRREFLRSGTAAAGAAALLTTAPIAAADTAHGSEPTGRKIKLGWIGCGGRGAWLAKLFRDHGGYEFCTVADYFPDLVHSCGEALGVDKARRFTGLSGYKKVLDCGVEALGVLDVPCFYPEQAAAAVAAGCHVYIAKPVAVDAPGCLAIDAAGKLATRKNLCFLVDYQIPTDPVNIEVVQRIWNGGKSFLRGGPKHFGGGTVDNLYELGAKRNIATFHQSIVDRRFDNPTVRRAVDGTLAAILGREAAMRGVRMTMDELLKENRKLQVDLTGLNVG